VVQLLANRGLRAPEEIECFMNPPGVAEHPDPMLMVGMPQAVERIRRAMSAGEKIVVWGDFDADGVTATALLTMALKHFGGRVEPYVPHRVAEGYGLNLDALKAIAGGGAALVITVDCGISNREEIVEAVGLGLDLIVTDHHLLPAELPDVICINPKQYSEGCEDFEYLAGVGVAYQLVRALVKSLGKPRGLLNRDLLALVAIGTVADVAPLKGANRSLVQHGLAALPHNSLPGLRTMLDYAHVKLESMDTERVGFVIGPRLNAAGRMDDARTAYRLLMTGDEQEARELAQKLEAQNRRRQALMNAIAEQARELARGMDDETEIIVLHSPDWPADSGNPLGVVGLVAGKLVEEFGRPALVLAPTQVDGESRGSARSTSHLDIHRTLSEVQDLLLRFGGHSAAAGLSVKSEHVGELRRRLGDVVRARVEAGEVSREPVITADVEITLAEVTDGTLEAINRLAPFGSGNPSPLFMARGVRALDAAVVGGTHLKLMLADTTNISRSPVEAIAFRMGHLAEVIKRNPRVDLLFYIERREWRGDVHLQLRVRDLQVSVH
jgi:single-stranded-DNA-specific exonuclease